MGLFLPQGDSGKKKKKINLLFPRILPYLERVPSLSGGRWISLFFFRLLKHPGFLEEQLCTPRVRLRCLLVAWHIPAAAAGRVDLSRAGSSDAIVDSVAPGMVFKVPSDTQTTL